MADIQLDQLTHTNDVDSAERQSLAELEALYEKSLNDIGPSVSTVSNQFVDESPLEIKGITPEQMKLIVQESLHQAMHSIAYEAIRDAAGNRTPLLSYTDDLSNNSSEHLSRTMERREFIAGTKKVFKAGIGGIVTGGVVVGAGAVARAIGSNTDHSISTGLFGVGFTSIAAGLLAVMRAGYRFATGHAMSEQVIDGMAKLSETMGDRGKNKINKV